MHKQDLVTLFQSWKLQELKMNSKYFKLIRLMIFVGGFNSLWYTKNGSRKLLKFYCIVSRGIFIFQTILVNLNLKNEIDNLQDNWREAAIFFASTLTADMALYKCFLFDSDTMQNLFKEAFVHDKSVQSSPHHKMKTALQKHGDMVYKFFVIYAILFFCILFCLYVAIITFYLIGRNCDPKEESCVRLLAWPMYSPFSLETHYGYASILSFIGMTYYGAFVLLSNVALSSLCIFPTFKLLHLKHVLSNFHYYGRLRSKNENISIQMGEYYVVLECIKQHQKIIHEFTKLRMYTRTLFFLDFLTHAMQMAPYFLILMGSLDNIDVIWFMAFFCLGFVLFELFMNYWFAQGIVDESINIGIGVASSNWYEADVRTQKLLLLIILRSNRHLALSVGPFYDMQLGIFLRIIKTVYTVLTVFKNNLSNI